MKKAIPKTSHARWRHWAGVEEFPAKLGELLDVHEFGPMGEFAGLRPQRVGTVKTLVGRAAG